MSELRDEVRAFLDLAFPGASLVALAGDASTGRFHRVLPLNGPTAVVMDYGAAFDGATDDIVLTRIFTEADLPVPRILRVEPGAGLLVLEDLGDRTLESALLEQAGSSGALALLHRAVELAVRVSAEGTPVLAHSERAAGPALDAARFRFEMDFFLEHYAAALRGIASFPAGLRDELHALADRAVESPRRVLCHRDFHSRNLMLVDDGSLAMVDIQDARWGPEGYDLASLLQDAYVEIDEARVDLLMRHYLSELPEPPDPGFRDRFEVLCAQRMLKALGTFGFQVKTMGRARYLEAIPRTLLRLHALLPRNPETRRLHELLTTVGLLEDQG